jgi:DNA (cytosine-5)-methyltransferase 1
MQNKKEPVPVLDLFAGPGGLGEGFTSTMTSTGEHAFKIVLSIEKDPAAHHTLELRSFFRQFRREDVPDDYYLHLEEELTRDELFRRHPVAAAAARAEAWNVELGKIAPDEVDRRIRTALAGSSEWVLCGGPPCQAYSVIGRSRNGGIDPKDARVFLYKEYLRILAEHRPSIFIFENVKGLLSSKLGKNGIFQQILGDLADPHRAVDSASPAKYRIFSLISPAKSTTSNGSPAFDDGDFVIKSEEFGIPQSRHRLILLGVREDLDCSEIPLLEKGEKHVSVSDVLSTLPRLRSGLSRSHDSKEEWRLALYGILSRGVLDRIPNGNGESLREEIRRTLANLHVPRSDRGGEFVQKKCTCEYQPEWYCDARLTGVCNHTTRPHMTEDLYRYLYAACFAKCLGRSPELRDFPPSLLPNHKNVSEDGKQKYFDDRFRVQIPDKPSTTITSHIAKDGHYYIHYDGAQCRSLTVREAARLQTFPDNYLFCGSRTQQYVQVGNAVPPLLARQIAGVVAQVLARFHLSARTKKSGAAFIHEQIIEAL